MIDFAKVKAITIPEGVVKKIMSGNTLIWEAPSAEAIVSPEAMYNTVYVGGHTYINAAISIPVTPSAGDVFIFYVNDTAHKMTLYEESGYIRGLSDDGVVTISYDTDFGMSVRVTGDIGSPVKLKITMLA